MRSRFFEHREPLPPRKFTYRGREVTVHRRDAKRAQVYEAERAAFGDSFHDKIGDGSMEALQAFVDQVTSSGIWKVVGRDRKPRVGDGRGCRSALGGYRGIDIPRWARTRPIVLHELAHFAVYHCKHHWPWAETFVDLVAATLGAVAAHKLEREFDARQVPHREPKKRRMSPEARARLAEMGRRALAAYAARKKEAGSS